VNAEDLAKYIDEFDLTADASAMLGRISMQRILTIPNSSHPSVRNMFRSIDFSTPWAIVQGT